VQIVGACLCKSALWQHITIVTLFINMQNTSAENKEFAQWLLEVGSGSNIDENG
jgi:hypothetical protein